MTTASLKHPSDQYSNSWQIFKIMSEFVEGYHFLSQCKNEVTIFGSARLQPYDYFYKQAEQLGRLLGQHNFTTVTGGGPGIMEAANKGAFEVGGQSVGLGIELPMEQQFNKYVTRAQNFSYFFVRKIMLTSPSQAFVFFPGGFGTFDEFFQVVNEMNLGFVQKVPVILVGAEFWTPLMTFLRTQVVEGIGSISPDHLDSIQIVNSADEAFAIVKETKDHPNISELSPENFTNNNSVNWRIFRIMAEIVEGLDFLSGLVDNVTIIGTKKLNHNNPYYLSAYRISKALSNQGFNIVTGGGYGISEAANKAAFDDEKKPIGIALKLDGKPVLNDYLSKYISFDFPFIRHLILTAQAKSFICFPGGLGTMHQLFELLTLEQTGKMLPVPIVLVGKDFWTPLVTIIKEILLDGFETINAEDLNSFTLINHEDEVIKIVNNYRTHYK